MGVSSNDTDRNDELPRYRSAAEDALQELD
jgi:hypothetical protein